MKNFQRSISALTKALIASLTPNNNTASTTTDGSRGSGVVCVPQNGGSSHKPPCKPGDVPVRTNSLRRPESEV